MHCAVSEIAKDERPLKQSRDDTDKFLRNITGASLNKGNKGYE